MERANEMQSDGDVKDENGSDKGSERLTPAGLLTELVFDSKDYENLVAVYRKTDGNVGVCWQNLNRMEVVGLLTWAIKDVLEQKNEGEEDE